LSETARSDVKGTLMSKKKILLVDDSNTVLMMHRMLLSEAKYQLVFARNGKEAIEKASSEHPDIIFMDVMMPEMDGFEACRQIRTLEPLQKTPIIMVSTRAEQRHVELGFKNGCTEYITKPFNGPELLAKLRNHLGE
jgi:CheY-like chemotaxis protein